MSVIQKSKYLQGLLARDFFTEKAIISGTMGNPLDVIEIDTRIKYTRYTYSDINLINNFKGKYENLFPMLKDILTTTYFTIEENNNIDILVPSCSSPVFILNLEKEIPDEIGFIYHDIYYSLLVGNGQHLTDIRGYLARYGERGSISIKIIPAVILDMLHDYDNDGFRKPNDPAFYHIKIIRLDELQVGTRSMVEVVYPYLQEIFRLLNTLDDALISLELLNNFIGIYNNFVDVTYLINSELYVTSDSETCREIYGYIDGVQESTLRALKSILAELQVSYIRSYFDTLKIVNYMKNNLLCSCKEAAIDYIHSLDRIYKKTDSVSDFS